MAANYPPMAPTVRQHGTIVTPGTTTYSPPLTKLWVGNAGVVAIVCAGDTVAVNFGTVAAGTFINDIAISNVTTATTATGLLGFSG